MISYKIKYTKNAEAFIRANKVVGIRFIKALTEISQNPDCISYYDIKKFISSTNTELFCLRLMNYKAIFKIIETSIILVHFIDGYKNNKNNTRKDEKDSHGNGIIELILTKPINPSIN